METIISKARAVSAVLFAVAFLTIELIPLTFGLIRIMLRLLAIISAILYFVAVKKREPWNFLFWFWSAFLFPVLLSQFLLMGYIGQYIPTELISTWGLPTYLMLLPFILLGMSKYFKRIMVEMY